MNSLLVKKSVLFFFKGYILHQYPPRRVSIFQTFLLVSTKTLQPTKAVTLVFGKETSVALLTGLM